jgi:hypothetical protein
VQREVINAFLQGDDLLIEQGLRRYVLAAEVIDDEHASLALTWGGAA